MRTRTCCWHVETPIHCSPKCGLNGSSNQGTDNKRLLKLLTQENVLVGGFFGISGYVAAYTTTNLRERSHDAKKFKEPELFFWQKVESHARLCKTSNP